MSNHESKSKRIRQDGADAKTAAHILGFRIWANTELPNQGVVVLRTRTRSFTFGVDEESARSVGEALVSAADEMRSKRN
jgi:hypothetical protein